ncbi:MAG: FecR domain-containing protein [Pseudanabaenaceae cyanobacterium]
MKRWHMAWLGVLMGGCSVSYPPKPFANETVPTEIIAQVDEIRSRPVLVRFLNGTQDRTAQLGTNLRLGESVRTEGEGRAQVLLNNGAIVRIGGNSRLTLTSANQVQLDRGKFLLIGRVENGQPLKEGVSLQTPFGALTTRDGVVYGEVTTEGNNRHTLLVLEGNAILKLPNGGKEILLKRGEELPIKQNGVPETVQRPTQSDLERRFRESKLLFGFAVRFASQATWERDLKVALRTPAKVEYRPQEQTRATPVRTEPATVRRDPPPPSTPKLEPQVTPSPEPPVVAEPVPLPEPVAPAPEPVPLPEPVAPAPEPVPLPEPVAPAPEPPLPEPIAPEPPP